MQGPTLIPIHRINFQNDEQPDEDYFKFKKAREVRQTFKDKDFSGEYLQQPIMEIVLDYDILHRKQKPSPFQMATFFANCFYGDARRLYLSSAGIGMTHAKKKEVMIMDYDSKAGQFATQAKPFFLHCLTSCVHRGHDESECLNEMVKHLTFTILRF